MHKKSSLTGQLNDALRILRHVFIILVYVLSLIPWQSASAASTSQVKEEDWKSAAAPGPAPASGGYSVLAQDQFTVKDEAAPASISGSIDVEKAEPGKVLPRSAAISPAPAATYGSYVAGTNYPSTFQNNLEITPLSAYNLIVDSNVLSPSSYGPNSATLGARYCNKSGSSMSNVWAYIGDYDLNRDNNGADSTAGTYPRHYQDATADSDPNTDPSFNTSFPHLNGTILSVDYGDPTRFFALEHEAGSVSDQADASRYIGTLTAGACRTVYWLVSYPRKAELNTANNWVDVTGGVKPEDDLWLQYDLWGTVSGSYSYYTRSITLRNEISAMANKIWPNGDNKVPDLYLNLIQDALGWDTFTPSDPNGTTAYPGETITSQGIWYDFGVVGAGFDNNGDLVPDRNAWVQPIGDAGAYDPGCFRLVQTYGLLIVKLNDGTEQLIPFVDQMYFSNISDNNNGVVGLVYYKYMAMDGACTASLTPYQEVASGYDNEKFNADFGSGIPPLNSKEPLLQIDKVGPGTVAVNTTYTYTLTMTLPDPDGTSTTVTVGTPTEGAPLVFFDSVPSGLEYIGNSTSATATMTNYSSPQSMTRLWSIDSGATWTTTDPGTVTSRGPDNLVMIQWRFANALTSVNGASITGSVTFQARVPTTYKSSTVVNTGCLRMGDGPNMICDPDTTLLAGNSSITGEVFYDTYTTAGVSPADGIWQVGSETGINAVTVDLYWDVNGDGDYTDSYTLIDGYIDINNDGSITSSDDGTISGISIIDGQVDLVTPFGSITTADDGTFFGYTVIDGRLDVDGSGTITTSDDGAAQDLLYGTTTSNSSGAYCFGGTLSGTTCTTSSSAGLPAASTSGSGNPRYIVVVNPWDSDITTGYGPTTPIQYTKISLPASTQYGDATDTSEPSDFGFAPALELTKSVTNIGTVAVGDTVTYAIALTNQIPGSGTNSNQCSYYVWSSTINPTTGVNPPGGGPSNAQFQSPNNLRYHPDGNYAYTLMGDNTDTVGLYGYNSGNLGGTITSVEYIVHVTERVNLAAGDRLFVNTWYTATNNAAMTQKESVEYFGDGTWEVNNVTQSPATSYFTGSTGSSYIISRVLSSTTVTGAASWQWSDFTGDKLGIQLQGNKGTANGEMNIDAAGFRVTTDQTCGGDNTTLNPVPLTDTYNSTYFSFISADPAPATVSAGSLTWNNVGPIYAGQTKIVTVRLQALTTGSTPNTDNTATSTGSKFANGFPANSPVTDIATVPIVANANTRSITGRVFDDNNTNGWRTALWTAGNAETGFDTGDTGIQYIPVSLYACYTIGTSTLVTTSGTNKTCSDQGGEWRVVRTTITDSTGNYTFSNLGQGFYFARVDSSVIAGSQTADVNQNGTCTTCDSQSATELTNLDKIGADLVANTAITRLSFGYNVAAGFFTIGDLVFFDWNGDGDQDAEDEPINGVTLRLLSADNTQLTTSTTGSNGIYGFGNGTSNYISAYYTVRVANTSLPTYVVQSRDPNETTLIVDGYIDLDRDGTPNETTEDGLYNGYRIIDGAIDINGDNSITTADDGTFLTYPVYDGKLDFTRDGSANTSDDGTIYACSVCDNQSPLRLIANDNTQDFAYRPTGTGTIGDTVYEDINGNGSQGSGEAGIPNVTVQLQVDLNGDGTYVTIATDVTDSSGKYLFTGLPTSTGGVTYRVLVSRTSNSTAIPNDTRGNDFLPVPGAGITISSTTVYQSKTLTDAAPNNLTADFGFAPPATIGDTVYQDVNANGVQDYNEPGISGITVTLYTFTDANSNHRYDPGETLSSAITTDTTDSSGKYEFGGLDAGNYVVVVTPPSGATLTGDPSTDGVSCVGLTPTSEPSSNVCDHRDGMYLYYGTLYLGADFGYQYTTSGFVGDTLWIDTDNDGVRDSDEAGIDNVTVYLCSTQPCNSGSQIATTTTDADGYYSFANLTAGTYYVAYNSSDTDLTSLGLTQSFEKNDGTPDNQITVILTDIGGGVIRVSNINGTACSNCGLDADFGFRYSGSTSISGTVCLENTNNGYCGDNNTDTSGVLTSGGEERPYESVVVYLYKLTETGGTTGIYEPSLGDTLTLVGTTTTGTNGDYSFTSLAGGVYYVLAIGAPQSGLSLDSTTTAVNSGGDDSAATEIKSSTDPSTGAVIAVSQTINATSDTTIVDRDFAFRLPNSYDYGDLPQGTINSTQYYYETIVDGSPEGPSHLISGSPTLYMGTGVDADPNGQPSATASADTEENGVTIGTDNDWRDPGTGTSSGQLTFDITGSGWLMGWIDFNNDGDFGDSNEQVINQAVSGDLTNFTITTPYNDTIAPPSTGFIFARFRLFTSQPTFPSLAYAGTTVGGEVEDYQFPINSNGITTTPVTLSYFVANRNGNTVVFKWSTATETGNAGFNLYVKDGDDLLPINDSVIPSKVVDSLENQDYTYTASVNGDLFVFEDVSLTGETRQHGPFEIGKEYGAVIEGQLVNLEQQRKDSQAGLQKRQDKLRKEMKLPAAALKDASGKKAIPQLTGSANLLVRQTGIVRVTYETIRDAGLDLAGVPLNKIAVTNRGQMIPVNVVGKTKFGPGGYIEFYGQALDNLYTDTNVYVVQVSQSAAPRIAVNNAKVPANVASEAVFRASQVVNRQISYSGVSQSSDPWLEARMVVTNTPQSWNSTFNITALADPNAAASMEIVLWGESDFASANPDHHVRVKVNDVLVNDATFDGPSAATLKFDLPAGVLREGQNTLTIDMPADLGLSFDIVALDSYTVRYFRSYQAENGRLTFAAAGKAFTVTNLPTKNVIVYRLVDGVKPERVRVVDVKQDGATFTATFAGTRRADTYVVTSASALYKPAVELTRVTSASLNQKADLLVIAHPSFMDGIAPLVAARKAQGYKVNVVDVFDIYAQYNYGIFGPEGIKKYIAYAANNLGVRYVLLVGGDTSDYRNFLGIGSVSYIPSIYTRTGPLASFVPTDPSYADINDDGVVDVAIGRFPARSTAELALVVNKTLAYDAKTYGRTTVFAADKADGVLSFTDITTSLKAVMPTDWSYENVYLDQYNVSTARQKLIAAMNRGTALVTYTGHSGSTNWSFSNVFTTNDVSSLTNADKPFVAVQWGCWNTYYVNPRRNLMAQTLLFTGNKGAAASLGAVTLTKAESERRLGVLLYPRLSIKGMTLGQALLEAKRELAAMGYTDMEDVLFGWTLMGDPTLVIEP